MDAPAPPQNIILGGIVVYIVANRIVMNKL